MDTFSIKVAGCTVELGTVCEKTPLYFKEVLSDEPAVCRVALSGARIAGARPRYTEDADDAFVEFCELSAAVSDALLPRGIGGFHGVAFLYRGRAWIFTGPSGIGKTTQYINWKRLYEKEITMICGDKPFLRREPTGEITVCSSPWCGKERMKNDIEAPLGGIVCLLQRKENRIRPLPPGEAAIPLYRQFLSERAAEAAVDDLLVLERAVLATTPVWLLENRGDRLSARLCHDCLFEEENV